MRVIATLLTLSFLAIAIWLGQGLWQQLQRQPDTSVQLAAVRTTGTADRIDPATPPRRWPALFGTPKVVEPQPPQPPQVVPEPQPPAPPMPPIESLGYRLKGVVRNGSADWALVTHPTGDIILRIGDSLGETELKVEAIDAEGLWLSRGGERVLLGFETQSP